MLCLGLRGLECLAVEVSGGRVGRRLLKNSVQHTMGIYTWYILGCSRFGRLVYFMNGKKGLRVVRFAMLNVLGLSPESAVSPKP